MRYESGGERASAVVRTARRCRLKICKRGDGVDESQLMVLYAVA